MTKVKVLFVCLGNICRSPLAEAIFKNKVGRMKLADHLEIDSCGTANYHIGDQPDSRTIASAHKNGIEISHYCRQLTASDLEVFDIVIAMDQSNYQNIMRLDHRGINSEKVFLMRDFDDVGKGEVPDPYYGDAQKFQEVFEILDRSTDGLLVHVEENFLR